ncbi:MAG: hypothetical protein DRJ05_05790 [Bacteroidetes bacterium]|nr:MAG: hypothetical protein DRJ05_05790 [Bacteroidota bacterium]
MCLYKTKQSECPKKKIAELFGEDYYKGQLEKIRDIRSSERLLYQQITDIYAEAINPFKTFCLKAILIK